jgi:hypothetical protein
VRSFFSCVFLAIDVALAAACANPMQPEVALPQERDCEVFAVESDSVASRIPVQLRCAARVRVVCG